MIAGAGPAEGSPAPVLASEPAGSGRPTSVRRSGPQLAHALELLLVLALCTAVFAVHGGTAQVRLPYWVDEAWVAVSTRAPLEELPRVTSVTPLGWTLLLRPFAALPGDLLRLLPDVFHALIVGVGYVLGRDLGGRRTAHRVLAGSLVAVLLLTAPYLLVRDDLKPYTADGFVAVLLLWLVARADVRPGRGPVVAVGVAGLLGLLVSHTAALAVAAALLALAVTAAVRRDTRRLRDSILVGTVTACGLGLVYVLLLAGVRNEDLDEFWRGSYPSLGNLLLLVDLRTRGIGELFGLPSRWLLAFALALGVYALVRRGRSSVATSAVLLVLISVAAGLLRVYPLLAARTSTYLFVVFSVLVAAAVIGLVDLASRWRAGPATAVVVVACLVVAYAGSAPPRLLEVQVPDEDVRTATSHVLAHRTPGDVVLTNPGSAYGVGYYWRDDVQLQFPRNPSMGTGWSVAFPTSERVVVAGDRGTAAVAAAVREACALAQGRRIWLILSHLSTEEDQAWRAALARQGVVDDPGTGIPHLRSARCAPS